MYGKARMQSLFPILSLQIAENKQKYGISEHKHEYSSKLKLVETLIYFEKLGPHMFHLSVMCFVILLEAISFLKNLGRTYTPTQKFSLDDYYFKFG